MKITKRVPHPRASDSTKSCKTGGKSTSSLSLLKAKSRMEIDLPPEIIEMIVLQLPLSKVLDIMQLSKSWKNAIKGSKILQRALFLLPAVKKGGQKCSGKGDELESIACRDDEDQEVVECWREGDENGPIIRPVFNPLLLDFFFFSPSDSFEMTEFSKIGDFRNGRPFKTNINALLHAGDSWRNVLMLQPMCKSIFIPLVGKTGHQQNRMARRDGGERKWCHDG
ncbi:uncharacterized protein RCC_02316 [Ramularia collo-cygni]|uniref:F-box domain-containing protein n=1 Tax=Ramularia collo-cygni TaxID=112498 RepID=A0A2D3V7Z0_9PEZI|nr:uncharacterized protein RCC_02316 [Ramularia collo-cygni]CZT16473.1 uncharacterized protein RCC_02316 [Ramularia collo-cygni]